MGLGEMMGVKVEKITPKGTYTLEEFYNKIKDVKFDAGQPQYVKNGLAYVIVFPQLDRNNQVQILQSLKKGTFEVQRSAQPAGVGNLAANMALDKLTGGLSGLSGAFGDTKKRCMALVTRTAEQIRELDL